MEQGKRQGAQPEENKKSHLNMKKPFFMVRVVKHRLPREAVKSPSLEVFKTQLDTVVGNML